MARDRFEGIEPRFQFHYMFALHCFKHKGLQRISTNSGFLNFFELIRINMDDDSWRIRQSGTRYLHLWTVSDDWEIVLKLMDYGDFYPGALVEKNIR